MANIRGILRVDSYSKINTEGIIIKQIMYLDNEIVHWRAILYIWLCINAIFVQTVLLFMFIRLAGINILKLESLYSA